MSTDPVPAALRAIASDERVARAEGALREATAQLRKFVDRKSVV